MRRELSKAVRSQFRRQLALELPEFQPPAEKTLLPAGLDLYQWRMSDRASAFILLQPHRTQDRYFVEIAVSEHHRFPSHPIVNSSPTSLVNGEACVRLTRFWRKGPMDQGFDLDPEALQPNLTTVESPLDTILPKVPAFVGETIAKLKEFGIPFVSQFR